MHVLPVDVAWVSWSLYLEIERSACFLFWTQILVVSIASVKLLLDLLDILVFLVSNKSSHNISVILILLQSIDLFLIVCNQFILLKFYSVTSSLKQINHLFIIEN